MTDTERTLRHRAEMRGFVIRKLALGDYLLIGPCGQAVIGSGQHLLTFMDEELVRNVQGLRPEFKTILAGVVQPVLRSE